MGATTPNRAVRHDGEAGLAALELALILPVLALVLTATFDLARFAAHVHKTRALAHAGATAITKLPSIPAPVAIATGLGTVPIAPPLPSVNVAELVALPPNAAASSRLFWGCPRDSDILAVTWPVCADGKLAAAYAEVEITYVARRLFNWPGRILPERISATTLMRIG